MGILNVWKKRSRKLEGIKELVDLADEFEAFYDEIKAEGFEPEDVERVVRLVGRVLLAIKKIKG